MECPVHTDARSVLRFQNLHFPLPQSCLFFMILLLQYWLCTECNWLIVKVASAKGHPETFRKRNPNRSIMTSESEEVNERAPEERKLSKERITPAAFLADRVDQWLKPKRLHQRYSVWWSMSLTKRTTGRASSTPTPVGDKGVQRVLTTSSMTKSPSAFPTTPRLTLSSSPSIVQGLEKVKSSKFKWVMSCKIFKSE